MGKTKKTNQNNNPKENLTEVSSDKEETKVTAPETSNTEIENPENNQITSPSDKTKAKKDILTTILNTLKLLSSLGTGTVLTLTAIRAYSFSKCYGVPFADLINIKITGELIIEVIPLVVIACFIAFAICLTITKNTFSKHWILNLVLVELMLDFLGGLSTVSMFLYWLNANYKFLPEKVQHNIVDLNGINLNYHSPCVICYAILCAILLVFSKILYLQSQLIQNKKEINKPDTVSLTPKSSKTTSKFADKNKFPFSWIEYIKKTIRHHRLKQKKECALVHKIKQQRKKRKKNHPITLEILSCVNLTAIILVYIRFVLTPFEFNIIDKYTHPESEKRYEIAFVTDSETNITKEYVTICTNTNGKLILECKCDTEKNELIILKGSYKYIKADGNKFTYKNFNNVIIDDSQEDLVMSASETVD